MMALAGYPLGLRFRFLDPDPDAPAGQVAELIRARYDDEKALSRLARGASVVTVEFENVPARAAKFLEGRAAFYPGSAALSAAQERLVEKRLFQALGIPTPRFAAVESREGLERAAGHTGLPAVLKTRRLGYDGKGQFVVRQESDLDEAWRVLRGVPLILEEWIAFEREVSIIGVRGRGGETAFYPLVENRHERGILRLSLAPAPGLTAEVQARAEEYARRIMDRLGYVGVLAVECFVRGGDLLASEMACRVHNSGHWTIEGAECSQFENHLRAVLGRPIGSTAARGWSAMVNLIGELPDMNALLAMPGVHPHLYGKAPRPWRKIGHATAVCGSEVERDRAAAALLAAVRRE